MLNEKVMRKALWANFPVVDTGDEVPPSIKMTKTEKSAKKASLLSPEMY